MKIIETIQPSIKSQRTELSESLIRSGTTDEVTNTHMNIFEADRGVWREFSFEDIMAELDQDDQKDANN